MSTIMEPTSANQTAEGIRAMTSNPFQALALQLMSERGFTIAPDGSIQVPAANVNVKTPVKTFGNDDNDAKDSDKTFDNLASDDKENLLTNALPQQTVSAVAPDNASAEAVVKSIVESKDVKENVLTKPLTNDLQEVLTRFAGRGCVKISDVANAFDISRQLAQYRLRRLVELTDGLVTKGEHRGEYNFTLLSVSAVGACAEQQGAGVAAPNGATVTMASNREERTEPNNYSKSNTYGKSLTKGAKVIASNRGEQSSEADQSQEPSSDCSPCSNGRTKCKGPTIPPAPASSPKPPAIDDPDELDEDERDAYDAEEFAVSGHAPIRLELPKHKRPRPRFSPPPTPRRTPYSYADAPVVVEDDDEGPNNGYDPD